MTIFDKLREKFGSHEAAARHMEVSIKTYFNWKRKLLETGNISPQALALLEKHLGGGVK